MTAALPSCSSINRFPCSLTSKVLTRSLVLFKKLIRFFIFCTFKRMLLLISCSLLKIWLEKSYFSAFLKILVTTSSYNYFWKSSKLTINRPTLLRGRWRWAVALGSTLFSAESRCGLTARCRWIGVRCCGCACGWQCVRFWWWLRLRKRRLDRWWRSRWYSGWVWAMHLSFYIL